MAQWRKKEKDATYSDTEIESRLQDELPKWYYEDGWIRRKYNTSGWKGTLMVINTGGHLAEAAWHHPDIAASYAFVIVKLMNHAANLINVCKQCHIDVHRKGIKHAKKKTGKGYVLRNL